MRLCVLSGPPLALLTLTAGMAQAQTHACGAGPGPDEVMVGETSGGQGVGAEPLCDGVQEPAQGQPEQPMPMTPPPPQVLFYGAVAIDRQMHVTASWNNPSAEAAMTSAYQACVDGHGGACRVISKTTFRKCGAVAADGAKLVYMVTDPVCFGLAGKTMDWCKSKSKVGQSHMLTGSIVAGSSWDHHGDGADSLNRGQMSLTEEQLDALSQ